MFILTTSIQHYWRFWDATGDTRVLGRAFRGKKKKKKEKTRNSRHQEGEKEVKLSLFANVMVFHIE